MILNSFYFGKGVVVLTRTDFEQYGGFERVSGGH